jgi:hypothetical protein
MVAPQTNVSFQLFCVVGAGVFTSRQDTIHIPFIIFIIFAFRSFRHFIWFRSCIAWLSDGVCRLAAAPFVASTFAGADFEFAHLTNHCIAARHPDYGRIAPGNEMFFGAFDAYLKSSASSLPSTSSSASISGSSASPKRWSVATDLMPQICSVLALAFESVRDVRRFVASSLHLSLHYSPLNACLLSRMFTTCQSAPQMRYQLMQPPPDARVASFQLFGFDLMLDADFHLWLLEVNATPAVAAPLLERLVADLIELAIRPAFQASSEQAAPADVDANSDVNGALARWLEVPLSAR